MPVEEVQDELAVRGPNFGDVEESACKVESSEVQNPLAGGVIILSDSDSTESESGESCIATDSSDNDEPPQKRPRAFQAEKHYREADMVRPQKIRAAALWLGRSSGCKWQPTNDGMWQNGLCKLCSHGREHRWQPALRDLPRASGLKRAACVSFNVFRSAWLSFNLF